MHDFGQCEAVCHSTLQADLFDVRIALKALAVRKVQFFKFGEAPHLHRLDGSYTNW